MDRFFPPARLTGGFFCIRVNSRRNPETCDIALLPNPSPRAIPTRSATRFPTRCWTPFSHKDPYAHVACECCATTGMVLVMGEITTSAYVPIEPDRPQQDRRNRLRPRQVRLRRPFLRRAGDRGRAVPGHRHGRKPRRATWIMGAGDQGMMFGYACDETPEYMPLAISPGPQGLPHALAEVRKSGAGALSAPRRQGAGDRRIRGRHRPVRVEAVVLSTQHAPEATHDVRSSGT